MATSIEGLDISRFPSVALIDMQTVVPKEDSMCIPEVSTSAALPFVFPKIEGSQPEAGSGSKFSTQIITTGTKGSRSEGDKHSSNSSPRSVFEGPRFSATTVPAMPAGPQALSGNTLSQDSLDWQLNSEDEGFLDEDDLGSEAHEKDGSGAEGEESNLRRSARNHQSSVRKPREKRKVGRPIIYTGDPDAPDLTPQERRRIRRRIANRESARRVRAKRQDLLEEMSIKAKQLENFNAKLLERATSAEGKHQSMMEQVAQMSECLRAQTAENARLQAEVAKLRQSMSAMGSPVDAEAVKAALAGGTNFVLTAVQPPLQQQKPPAVLPQTVSSGFAHSPFSAAATLPLLDAGEPAGQVATVTSGVPLQPVMAIGEGLPPLPHPARVLSKALSVEQVMAAMSIDPLDRSLSEFLKEVACF